MLALLVMHEQTLVPCMKNHTMSVPVPYGGRHVCTAVVQLFICKAVGCLYRPCGVMWLQIIVI